MSLQDSDKKISEPILLIKTSRFGNIEVGASKIIQFPSGLVGYEKPQIFALFDYHSPFHWLQSIDDPELGFVVLDGLAISKEFEMQPPYGDPDTDLQEGDEYAVILIVNLKEPVTKSTVNLAAPLFVNMKNRRGVQVVYDDPKLSIQHPLFPPEVIEAAKSSSKEEKEEKKQE